MPARCLLQHVLKHHCCAAPALTCLAGALQQSHLHQRRGVNGTHPTPPSPALLRPHTSPLTPLPCPPQDMQAVKDAQVQLEQRTGRAVPEEYVRIRLMRPARNS